MSDGVGDELLAGILVADEIGMEIEEYCILRSAGATHDEALWVVQGEFSIGQYVCGRAGGLGHGAVMAALEERINVGLLVAGLRDGLDYDEILEAGRAGFWLDDYRPLRREGVTHREVMALVGKWTDRAREYGNLRKCGASHRQALSVFRRRIDVGGYVSARSAVGHREALQRAGVATGYARVEERSCAVCGKME